MCCCFIIYDDNDAVSPRIAFPDSRLKAPSPSLTIVLLSTADFSGPARFPVKANLSWRMILGRNSRRATGTETFVRSVLRELRAAGARNSVAPCDPLHRSLLTPSLPRTVPASPNDLKTPINSDMRWV